MLAIATEAADRQRGPRSGRQRAMRRWTAAACGALLALGAVLGCAGPGGAPATAGRETASQPGPAPAPAASTGGSGAGANPVVGGAAGAGESPPGRPAPEKVRVGTIAAINDAGLYLALERGYFATEQLDVELVPFRASAEMIPLMGSGQLEVGSGAAIPSIFNAIARGVPLRLVGDKGSYLGSCALALVVRRDLADQVRDIEDLAGRKVAVINVNVATHMDLIRALEAVGMAPSQVEVVPMPFPDMNLALANGAVDAALVTEPFTTEGIDRGISSQVRCGEDLNPGRQYAMMVFSPHFLQGGRSAGERFMVAYIRGVRDYTDAMRKGIGKEEVLDVLARHAGGDREVYRRMRPIDLDPDSRPNRASIAFDQSLLLRLGAVQQAVDLDAVVDGGFAEAAMARLGAYR